MLVSHVIVYYLYLSNTYYDGALFYPNSLNDLLPFFIRNVNLIKETALPTERAFIVYSLFILSQAIFAMVLPGIKMKGLPIPSQGNK
jgi:Delta24(24(1))-sterol reductase